MPRRVRVRDVVCDKCNVYLRRRCEPRIGRNGARFAIASALSRNRHAESVPRSSGGLPWIDAVMSCGIVGCCVPGVGGDVAGGRRRQDGPRRCRLYEETVNKAIEYLRTKGQAADGSYGAEAEPGVTAHRHHGRAARRPHGRRSAGGQEPQVPGRLRAPRRRHLCRRSRRIRTTKPAWRSNVFRTANRDHRYDKLLAKRRERSSRELQWDAERGARQVERQLRRRRLRRLEAARPVEHRVPDRRPEVGRPRAGRRGDAEGPGLRLALPEPGDRVQHHGLCRQESRWRLLLHAGRRRRQHGRQDATTADCAATAR